MPVRFSPVAPRSRNEALDQVLDREIQVLREQAAAESRERVEGMVLEEARRTRWVVRGPWRRRPVH